jgi:hypothetical protein
MKKLVRVALSLSALQLCVLPLSHAANQASADWRHYVTSKPEIVLPAVLKRTSGPGEYDGTFMLSLDPKDGSVAEVKVVKSTGLKLLDSIYVMNFFQWKFQPGTITTATIPRHCHIWTGRRARILH